MQLKEEIEEVEKIVSDAEQSLISSIKDIVSVDEEGSKGMMRNFMSSLKKSSAPKQLAVGAGMGWCAGYLTMKVGKMAATAVGGSLLLLQIAHYKGYIRVDWSKMTDDTSSLADVVKDKLKIKSKSGFEKFQEFAAHNIYVAGGFTGGFFLGIASS
uniref:FUN14 domain-containing protein 1 n=1 Tax=Caligus rogercresseyi TaxID=217165 RepID=C1BMS8_CALRO|nr:FUN14 domain-containing protein 1 [Caligus rogercresseyi]ACO11109.1 FUN14 domain-containing protein 1 [Caligus rogercresseyi]|eukprot:TRINITY_DN1012_c0_g1_i1.p1 TRINITY_DN1012_c0_g1~~TRINITY_DN1012_c0_g1_i1.p1  ORF type:complete len:156 (-),score=62.80 TRINITY_DN1012_c0_g1_i1:225-692(-)